MFELFVEGIPVPQGSATAFPVGGRCVVTSANNKKLKPWRALVTQAVLDEMDRRRDDEWMKGLADKSIPISVSYTFYMPELVRQVREHHTVAPDLDKLVRAINDSLTDAGLWGDDAQVIRITASKRYAFGVTVPGVEIEVREAS